MNNIVIKKERDSNFELLRIVSQFYIVLYHICLYFIYPNTGQVFYKAIQLTLHIGVIDFVLISGYFTIKTSSKGLLKLLAIIFVYSFPEIVINLFHAHNIKHFLYNILFVSNSHFWFIKTYLYLYLIAPILNYHLKNSNDKQRWYILIVFFFISIYVGTTHGDDSLSSGKNIANFIFIYLLGNQLYKYKDYLNTISIKRWIFLYIILNAVLIFCYSYTNNSIFQKVIWRLSFPYCSPIIMVNAFLFFMIFSKIKIRSKKINYVAKSSLAIYLIHDNRPYIIGAIGSLSLYMINTINNSILLFFMFIVLTLLIIVLTVLIDKLLTPLWNKIELFGNKIYQRLGY